MTDYLLLSILISFDRTRRLRGWRGGFGDAPQRQQQQDAKSDNRHNAKIGFFRRGRGEIFEVTAKAEIDIVGALNEAVFATLGAFESGLRHHGLAVSLRI
jgi:hypothetical protein